MQKIKPLFKFGGLVGIFLSLGCHPSSHHLSVAADSSLQQSSEPAAVRSLQIGFVKEGTTPSFDTMRVAVEGLHAGQGQEVSMPESWEVEPPGVWQVQALDGGGHVLLTGSARYEEGQEQSHVLLRSSNHSQLQSVGTEEQSFARNLNDQMIHSPDHVNSVVQALLEHIVWVRNGDESLLQTVLRALLLASWQPPLSDVITLWQQLFIDTTLSNGQAEEPILQSLAFSSAVIVAQPELWSQLLRRGYSVPPWMEAYHRVRIFQNLQGLQEFRTQMRGQLSWADHLYDAGLSLWFSPEDFNINLELATCAAQSNRNICWNAITWGVE